MKTLKRIAAVLALVVPSLAFAGWASGTVLDVTAEGMPTYVAFKLSSMPPGCQPQNGQYFSFGAGWPYYSSADTTKAVYAMLMAAVLSGKAVYVEYNDSNQCKVGVVHGVY